ncbi:hypothetical protein ACGFYP_34595 [Streptomyces sp. NPDC048370]|uniref:hypothetical protein n=1 Tax=Streptomyces sp. NPDC048370 TaxID=3365540 RepID=UPI00371E9543
MSDTPAVDQLVAALTELRNKAGGLTLGQIETLGRMQRPPVSLGKSKLSPWFTGKAVPDSGPAFDTLVRLLEDLALQKTGTPKLGVGRWQQMRNAAASERRLLPETIGEEGAETDGLVSHAESSPVGTSRVDRETMRGALEAMDKVLNTGEELDPSDFVPLLEYAGSDLAQPLRTVTDPDADFATWTRAAIELCRKLDEEGVRDGSPAQYTEILATLEPLDRLLNGDAESVGAAEMAALLDLIDPEAAGLMRTLACPSAPSGVRVRAALDFLERLEDRQHGPAVQVSD